MKAELRHPDLPQIHCGVILDGVMVEVMAYRKDSWWRLYAPFDSVWEELPTDRAFTIDGVYLKAIEVAKRYREKWPLAWKARDAAAE